LKVIQGLLAILIVVSWVCGSSSAQTATPDHIPTSAIIEITLNKAPGLGMPETKWDVSYELRLATEADLWEASQSGKLKSDTERLGDLLKQGNAAQTAASPGGETLVLEIPFDKPAQERLKNQPKTRINLTAGSVTAENIQRLKTTRAAKVLLTRLTTSISELTPYLSSTIARHCSLFINRISTKLQILFHGSAML